MRAEMLPWLAFGACGAIWGSTFLVISIGNDALAPVWAATLRLALAAVLLALVTRARGRTLPRGPALRAALVYGVAQFGVNLPLLYWAEGVVPSGLAAVIYATTPLTSALMTRAIGMERLTAGKILGSLVALAGVALLFSSSFRADARVALAGLAAIFVAATTSGAGTIVLKRGPRQDPFAANAVGSAIGAAICAVVSVARGEEHALPATFAAAWPVLYLTLAGSLGAYVLMTWLVSRWPVTRMAYVAVIVPVIALALGVLLRGETIGGSGLAGAALVLAGLLVGTRQPREAAASGPVNGDRAT